MEWPNSAFHDPKGMKQLLQVLLILSACLTSGQVMAQTPPDSLQADSTAIPEILIPKYPEVDEQELVNIIDQMPVFGIYQDNYFISGIPLDEKITDQSADAKYQISFRHRITKTILPFNTALLLTYTQRSFWNVYQQSLPFRDSNFNPGLGLSRPLAYRGRLLGVASAAVEHESNGRDSVYSRSWNYATMSVTYFHNQSLSFNSKVWLGFLAEENKDLYDYKGYGLLAANYSAFHDNLRLSLTINPRRLGKFNTIFEVNYRPMSSLNQYLFLQWYRGYAENLLDYNEFTSMIRLGFCIKPQFRNFY